MAKNMFREVTVTMTFDLFANKMLSIQTFVQVDCYEKFDEILWRHTSGIMFKRMGHENRQQENIMVTAKAVLDASL